MTKTPAQLDKEIAAVLQEQLTPQARHVLYKLQQSRGNALYVTANFGSPEDRSALMELEGAGLVLLHTVWTGVVSRKQAKLTPAGRTIVVSNPWSK